MDSCCILCIKKYVSTPCVDVHVVSFCNLIGTARPRQWKSTTLPPDVTRLSPPPPPPPPPFLRREPGNEATCRGGPVCNASHSHAQGMQSFSYSRSCD